MTPSSEVTIPEQLYCPICERMFEGGVHCPDDATRLVRLDAPDAMIGRDLDGRYTLVSKLGSGGMGAVYRATQHSVGREVAVKLIAANLVSDPEAIKRFLREAKLASRLAHPNAVGVLDFGQTSDHVFYLVMELVVGRTLDALLEAEPVLSVARVIRIGIQICDALEGAHELQIVHRDLKPANVMVLAGARELVKVLDFGIARSLANNENSTTHTGSAVGTPGFMSPEIASGEEFDGRADLYSLGCMLYLMATGRLPFSANSVQEMLLMHVGTQPAPMYGVPDALGAVVMRLLEKAPARRFATAAATREALEAALFTLRASPITAPVAQLATSEEPTMMTQLPVADPALPLETPTTVAPLPAPVATPPPEPVRKARPAPPRSRNGVVVVASVVTLVVATATFLVAYRLATDDADERPAFVVRHTALPSIDREPPVAAAIPDAAAQPDAAVAEAVESPVALDAGVPDALPMTRHHRPAAAAAPHADAGADDDTTTPPF